MSPVPLRLESFFVEDLTYRACRDYDQKRTPSERVDVKSHAYTLQDSDKRIMVRLVVKIGTDQSANTRCELELNLVGFFVLAERLGANLRAAMLTQNAPSILYGIARQVVAETTGNGPWGKVFLPTVNFVELAHTKAPGQQSDSQVDVLARDAPRRRKK